MKLGTFRVNDDEWKAFKVLCKTAGSTASAEIVAFIRQCNESGELGSAPESSCIDESLDSRIELAITTAITPLKAEIAELKKSEAAAA